jgi:hypothetical protein
VTDGLDAGAGSLTRATAARSRGRRRDDDEDDQHGDERRRR